APPRAFGRSPARYLNFTRRDGKLNLILIARSDYNAADGSGLERAPPPIRKGGWILLSVTGLIFVAGIQVLAAAPAEADPPPATVVPGDSSATKGAPGATQPDGAVSEAEQIAQLQRAIQTDHEQLAQLEAALKDPRQEYAKAEAEFERVDAQ